MRSMPPPAKSSTASPGRSGFEGRLVVLGEPGIALGDCRIEWADGGVNRDTAAAEAAIGEAVARYVSARRGLADATRELRRCDNE